MSELEQLRADLAILASSVELRRLLPEADLAYHRACTIMMEQNKAHMARVVAFRYSECQRLQRIIDDLTRQSRDGNDNRQSSTRDSTND